MSKLCAGCGAELKFLNTPTFNGGVLKDGDQICSKCFTKMMALIGGGKFKAKNFSKDEVKNYVDNYETLLKEMKNKSIEIKNSKITNKVPVNSNKESATQSKLETSSNPPLNNLSKCPKCGSEEWKLASLIHKEGVSSFSGISGGFNTAPGRKIGANLNGLSGSQQTELSKQAAPPMTYVGAKVLLVIGIITGVIGLFVLGEALDGTGAIADPEGHTTAMIWLAVSIICIVGSVLRFFFSKNKYKLALKSYNKTRMCTRCGSFYVQP